MRKQRSERTIQELVRSGLGLLFIAMLFVLGVYLYDLFDEAINAAVQSYSYASMALYVVVFAASIVCAPITATPLIAIAARVWGVGLTTTLSVVGWTFGAVIAFELARKFGRPFVVRLFSKRQISRLERLVPEHHIFLSILILRAITPFDGLSYILGLTPRVHFPTFFWATLLGLIPFCLTVAYLGSLPANYLYAGLALAALVSVIAYIEIQRRARRNWTTARTICGHPSLTIFVCYAPNLVSALDPGSTVFVSREGDKNMSPPGTQARTQSSLRSIQKARA